MFWNFSKRDGEATWPANNFVSRGSGKGEGRVPFRRIFGLGVSGGLGRIGISDGASTRCGIMGRWRISIVHHSASLATKSL